MQKIRNNTKYFAMLLGIIISLLLFISSAHALAISNAEIKEVSDRYAIVAWQTDKDADSSAIYGKTETAMAGSGIMTKTGAKNHSVLLLRLDPNTEYFFNITSEAQDGEKAVYGILNFTTALTDTIAPFIDVLVPEFWKEPGNFKLSGRTEPNAEIYIRINGNLDPAGFNATREDGSFSLSAMRLSAKGTGKTIANQVKIIAKDPSNNENFIEKTVYVDESPPDITITSPERMRDAKDIVDNEYGNVKYFAFGESQMIIKGDSDEPAEMSVYMYPGSNLIATINISSPWEINVPFDKEFGKYALKFYAVDRAGNVFERYYVINVDKRPISISKHNLDEIKTSYVVHRTVTGKTKPGAIVIILVNNRTTSEAAQFLKDAATGAGDIHLTTEGGQNIPGSISELIARTTGKKPDYVATADEEGNFKIEIELETSFKLDASQALAQFKTNDAWKNDVTILAVDAVGRTASVTKTIYYTRCGAGGDFTISSPVPSPATIPETILKQGFGMFSLAMDLEWGGLGPVEDVEFPEKPKIKVQTGLAREDIEGKYNLTLGKGGVFPSKPVQFYPRPTPQSKKLFAIVKLDRTTHDFGMTTFEELEFPLMVELTYTYLKPGSTERTEPITQRKCIDVNIQVEPEIELNKGDAKKFLIKTADALDNIVKGIDKVLNNYVKPAKQGALISCGIGTVVQWGRLFANKIVCGGTDIRTALKDKKCTTSYDSEGALTCTCNGGKDSEENEKLKACCDNTINALKWQKWLVNTPCDRIFCPSVPSFSHHTNTYEDLLVLRPTSTRPWERSPGAVMQNIGSTGSKCSSLNTNKFDSDDCKGEFQRAWGTVAVIDWPYKNEWDMAATAANRAEKTNAIKEIFKRASDFSSNLCSVQDPNKVKIVSQKANDKAFMVYNDPNAAPGVASVKVDYGQYKEITTEDATIKNMKTGEIDTNAKKAKVTETKYFETELSDIAFNTESGCCENTGSDSNGAKCKQAVSGYTGKQQVQIGCVEVPPDVLAAVASHYSDKFVFSPTSGIISATRAVCIPAVDGYLTSYKNILDLVSRCFRDVANGEQKSGACNSLLSEVVCDFAIDSIMCASRKLNLFTKTSGFAETNIGAKLNPFNAASKASTTITNTLSNRYGETAGYKALFNENALLHATCVGAFTGDWDFEGVMDLLSESTVTPVKPTCAVFPANRRFVTSNPLQQGKTTYLYHAGGLLSAGSDIKSISVQLICSNDNSCTRYPVSSNPNGECDCYGMSESKKLNMPFTMRTLKRGQIFDEALYYPVNDAEYRYDKARITYTYKDNDGQDKTEFCQAELKDDGIVPSTCQWSTLGFRCEFEISDTGTARFIGKPKAVIPAGDILYLNDRIEIDMRTEVVSPKENRIPKYARFRVLNKYQQEIASYNLPLEEGVYDYTMYPGTKIEADLFPRQAAGGITIKPNAYQNGVYFVDGSMAAGAGAGYETEFIVTFSDGTGNDVGKKFYECHSATKKKESGIEIIRIGSILSNQKNELLTADTSTGAIIKCNDIQFRIINQDKVKIGTPSNDQKFDDYPGTAYHVTYVKPTADSSSCALEPEDWKVEVTLYHSASETGDPSGSRISEIPVYGDDGIEKETIPIKVMCKPKPEQLKTTAEIKDFTVKEFTITPTTITKDEQLTVDYLIQQNKGVSINILELNFCVKDGKCTKVNLLHGGKLRDTLKISIKNEAELLKNRDYNINLIINGVIYEEESRDIKIS